MAITQTELKRLNAVLEVKRAELNTALRNREGIAIEKTADAADEVQLARERELAIRNLDRDSNLLRLVQAALDRIAKGCYGICLHCDQEIRPKRLEAAPWSSYCIKCQEAADRDELESIEVR